MPPASASERVAAVCVRGPVTGSKLLAGSATGNYLVAGDGRREDLRCALEAGFDRHLGKRVRLEALVRAIGDMDLVR